jgi:hypothetical protein
MFNELKETLHNWAGLKPIGPIAPKMYPAYKEIRIGVIYSRLFKYAQHTAGFTENSIEPRAS